MAQNIMLFLFKKKSDHWCKFKTCKKHAREQHYVLFQSYKIPTPNILRHYFYRMVCYFSSNYWLQKVGMTFHFRRSIHQLNYRRTIQSKTGNGRKNMKKVMFCEGIALLSRLCHGSSEIFVQTCHRSNIVCWIKVLRCWSP